MARQRKRVQNRAAVNSHADAGRNPMSRTCRRAMTGRKTRLSLRAGKLRHNSKSSGAAVSQYSSYSHERFLIDSKSPMSKA